MNFFCMLGYHDWELTTYFSALDGLWCRRCHAHVQRCRKCEAMRCDCGVIK